MLIIAVAGTGLLFSSLRDHRRQSDWIGLADTTKSFHLIKIRKEPARTLSGWKFSADLIARKDSSDVYSVSGGVVLYTKDSSVLTGVIPGRFTWVQVRLRAIENKAGSDFDFARYNRLNKITHQGYLLNRTQLEPLDSPVNSLPTILHFLRKTIRSILYEQLKDPINSGLATALFVGWKGGLDPDLKQHYTRTGTIHIIAISGLHISLVFEILWWMLYPLLFIRGGQLLRTILTLSAVWIFCFLAGGEASVLRAGIMFTATQVGRWMERPVSGLQALGLSMLLLLVADPDWLFDPGFQLSHGAVLGILLIQPLLSKMIAIQNPIVKNIWASASITLAATLGTLPFTCFYFQQFPLLFLPANLVAVPLSSLILIALFLLVPMNMLSINWLPISVFIEWLMDGMNGWIERLDRIPGMVWSW